MIYVIELETPNFNKRYKTYSVICGRMKKLSLIIHGCGRKMDTIQKEQIIQKLHDNGCRITKQRKIILDIILEDKCTSCKEIHYKALKRDKTIGVATVYRMLNTLEEIGALNKKNFYNIVSDEKCNSKSVCVIEFEDGSNVELSEKKMNEVIKCGLEANGYSSGKKLKKVMTKIFNDKSYQ
jgi:Fur family ferric uptake transcriptional regulator